MHPIVSSLSIGHRCEVSSSSRHFHTKLLCEKQNSSREEGNQRERKVGQMEVCIVDLLYVERRIF